MLSTPSVLSPRSKLAAHSATEAETMKACVWLALDYCRRMGVPVESSRDPEATVRAVAELLGRGR